MNNKIALSDILKPKWYVNQMKGWTFRSYMLLMIGLGVILGSTIALPINTMSILTMVAGMLGFTCTISITNARPINGILGLISALILIYISIITMNYTNSMLQVVYIVLLDLPVLLLPSWSKDVGQKIKALTVKGNAKKTIIHWLLTLLFLVVALILLYLFDKNVTNSPRPFTDSFTASIGITGALLTTLRFKDTYWFWTAQGIMSIILWGITASQGDTNLTLCFTYVLYLCNDIVAFTASPWFKHNEKKLTKTSEKK